MPSTAPNPYDHTAAGKRFFCNMPRASKQEIPHAAGAISQANTLPRVSAPATATVQKIMMQPINVSCQIMVRRSARTSLAKS